MILSDMLKTLIENNTILKGIFETIYMTLIATTIAYILGLPLGVLLNVTDSKGLNPNKVYHLLF